MNSNKQPTYKRQRFLLQFITQLEASVTATELQKLVFLNVMETKSNFYEFIQYMYGAYSFQLAEDLEILCRDGYVSMNKSRICAVEKTLSDSHSNIAIERSNTLLRKAYREYPYYTINSEITSRLFHGEELKHIQEEKNKYLQNEQILFTIGYEGKSIEAFVNILIQKNVKVLCDVRKNPLSRKFGFSKRMLEHIVENVGIHYIHIPELGIESSKRSNLNSFDDYISLFKEYSESLSNNKDLLEQIYSLVCIDKRIALMCYEHEADMCHRHVIRDYLTSNYSIRNQNL